MDFDFGSREDQDQEDLDIPTGTRAPKPSSIFDLLDDDDNNEDHDHLMGGDIGSREQGFLQGKGGFDDAMRGATTAAGGRDEDEEDILGMLSKPVEVVIANKVFFYFYYVFAFKLFCRHDYIYLFNF